MSQLTVLQAAGKCLTKIFECDRKGQIVKRSYDSASLFQCHVHEFHGVGGLFDLQTELQGRRDCCVIHAPPGRWHPGAGKLAPRRLYAAGELADDSGRLHKPARKGSAELWQRQEIEAGRLRPVTVLPTHEAAATDVLLLDFEKTTLPAGIDWRADLGYAAACLRLKLPPEFHGRRCTYFATSSAADLTKPDLGGNEVRMRIGFVLDRLIGYGEAKRWLAGVEGLDHSTLRPIQIIYTAAPRFRDGLHDPISHRLGLLDGADELVAVPHIEVPRHYRREVFTALGPVRSAEGLGLLRSPGMDAALERLAELGGASGSVRSVLLQATFAYIRDVGGDCVDIEALADALTAAADPYRSAGEIAGYGLEGLIAWCLEQVPAEAPPKPHYPAKGLPAKEAADALRREMTGAVGAAVAWWATAEPKPVEDVLDFNGPPPPPRVGFKAGAGIGKTGAALEQIAAIPGVEQMHVEIYVPDHTLAEELAIRAQAVASRLRVIVLRGRGTIAKPERALCQKVRLAELVAKAGLNVMGTLCRLKGRDGEPAEECEFAAVCPYLAQFRDTAPAIRIMPHANLFVVRNRDLPTPDLVVIDEQFWQGAVMHKRLALDRLTETGRWRSRPRKGEAPWKAGERMLEAEDFAIRVRNALQDGRDPRSMVSAEDCDAVAAIEWASLTSPGITPGMSLAQQTELMHGWQRDECSKAAKFWQLLAEEHRQPGRPMQRIVLERDAQSKEDDRRHLLHLHYCRELRVPAVPLILLDADLDPLIAAKLTPGLKMVEIPVRQQAHVVQVADRTCSMSFLLGTKAGDEAEQQRAAGRLGELQRLAARLLAGGGLMVTYKDALEHLTLPDTVSTLHLGNLRGRDSYKHLDAAVIAGRLEPGALTVEGMARALFGDEAESLQTIAPDTVTGRVGYPQETRRYRMAPGLLENTAAGPPIKVSVHPDPRAQAVLQQIREREIEQAVARLRLVHRDRPATIYLLTNLPVDLEITEVVTWNALCRNRAAEACHRWNGVWLVSPSEQSRCAPDLWPTAKAAQRWAKEKGYPKCYREYSIGVWVPFPAFHPPAATLVEYRLAGQRGSPHRAYVPGALDCAEAARPVLEAVTGHVARLVLVDEVHREPGVVVIEKKLPSTSMIASIETTGRGDPNSDIAHPVTTVLMDDRLPDAALEHAGPPFAATSPPASTRRQKSAARAAAVLAAVDSSAPGIIVNFEATVPELAEIRSGNRCRLCSKRMAWPGPAGLIFADGTAECHPCADASAMLGVYFWSPHPRSAGPESAADRQHPLSSRGKVRSGENRLGKAVGPLAAAQQGLQSRASVIQTDRR